MHTDNPSEEKLDHALVIGGSMAGMLAARVLADHFKRVTIVERDRFTEEGPVPRKGVPQARHVHALLKRGRITLERHFPGIGEELVAAGAPSLDMAKDIAWLNPAGWGVRFPSDLGFVAFSRDLLDWHVRRRLAAGYDGVRLLKGYDVTGLIPDAAGTGVAGVRVRTRNRTGGSGGEKLRADLVVDATGRASRAPEWLEALGYPRPKETMINAHLGDASRVYRRPTSFRADWKMAFVQAAPPEVTRGALLLPIEGDRWMLTLAGRDRDYPPTDEAGFMEFARSLRSPIISDAIEGAEPLSPIHGFRQTANRRRHYEKLSRQPHNLLVTGDAACAFNPVYAQGMTTAALGAEVLDECLRKQRRPGEDLTGLARDFQKRLAKVNKAPWMLATGEDFRARGVEGGKPNAVNRLMHRYMDRVLELSTKDASVRLTLLEVFNLLKPPTAILGPAVAARVLQRTIVARRSEPAAVSRAAGVQSTARNL
jgi:2-polyprenyl-6-methoxyphenol hydroxylase-like FAD-dependent oxidoreductase